MADGLEVERITPRTRLRISVAALAIAAGVN